MDNAIEAGFLLRLAEVLHREGELFKVARIASKLSVLGYHLSDPTQFYGRPYCFLCWEPWRVVHSGYLVLSKCCGPISRPYMESHRVSRRGCGTELGPQPIGLLI